MREPSPDGEVRHETERLRPDITEAGGLAQSADAELASSLASGELEHRVGPYRLERLLGRGAMGEVYLARHIELDHVHALKLLAPELVDDHEALRRFEREMESLARVDAHPGIVRVHSAGRTGRGRPYFAMEYVEGPSLKRALREGLDPETALDVVEQIAEALAHAHAQGLVHRDLKPENVLVDSEGRAFLSDFGLAKVLLARGQRLTRTGDLVGTPAFMAPEQTNPELGQVGPWSDVYGLGGMLHRIFTGSAPNIGASSMDIYTRLYQGQGPPPIRSRCPELSPALASVCDRALAAGPEERFPHAGAFLQALRTARAGHLAPPSPAAWRRRVLILLGLLAALSLAAASGALLWRRWQVEAQPVPPSAHERALTLLANQEFTAAEAALRSALIEAPPAERASVQALLDEARRGLFAAALANDDLAEARALLEAGPLEAPGAAGVLARTGAFAEALAARPPLPPAEAARVAAWAGASVPFQAALAELSPDRAAALAWELRPHEAELAPPPGEGAWALIARGERELAHGLTGLAAQDFATAAEEANDDAERRLAAQLGLLRVALARGDAEDACARWAAAWAQVGDVPSLARVRLLAWAGLLAQWPAASEGVTQALGERPLVAAWEAAPGLPRTRLARRLSRLQAGEDGADAEALPRLERARQALAQGESQRAQALLVAAGADPQLSRASFVLAEERLAREGRAGPLGLLLARGCDLARLAERGNERPGARTALAHIEATQALLASSPALWAARARALLVLHEGSAARAAADEALHRAPEEPVALLLRARALAAEAAPARSEADDAAWSEGGAMPELETAACAQLEAAHAAFLRAEEAAGAGSPLAQVARVEGTHWLLETTRRRIRAAQAAGETPPEPDPRWAAGVQSLLRELDRDAVRAARMHLAAAIEAEDDAGVARAEDELSALLGELNAGQRDALFLRASCGDPEARGYAEVLLGAQDLEAAALLAVHEGELRREGGEALLERAQRLAPRLPRALLARELAGVARLRPELGALELARAVRTAPGLTPLALRLLERLPSPPELLVRDEPVPGEGLWAQTLAVLSAARVGDGRAGTRADLARRACRLAGELVRREGPSAAASLLRGLAYQSLPHPPTHAVHPAVAADAVADLFAARAGAPGAGSLRLMLLPHLERAGIAAEADELLARGFVQNNQAIHEAGRRPIGPQQADWGNALAKLRRAPLEALDMDVQRTSLELAAALQTNTILPRLSACLRLQVVFDRSSWFRDPLDRQGQVFASLLTQLEREDCAPAAVACARAEHLLARVHRRRREHPSLLRQAGRAATRAARLAAPGGHARRFAWREPHQGGHSPLDPHPSPELEAARRLLEPTQRELGTVWGRLHQRGVALTHAALAAQALKLQRGDPLSPGELAGRWSCSRAILLTPRDRWCQRKAAVWLLNNDEYEESTLALQRALAAAHTRDELETTAHRFVFWQLRWWACDPGTTLADRRRCARLGLALAARAARQASPGGAAALHGLAADLAIDLAALYRDDPAVRATWEQRAEEELARAPREQLSPILEPARPMPWWRQVRYDCLRGDDAAALVALEQVQRSLEQDGLRDLEDEFRHYFAHDPLLPELERLPEVAAFRKALLAKN